MSAATTDVGAATEQDRWERVVLAAATLAIDRWSCGETPANLSEAIGAHFRHALWAHLVWQTADRFPGGRGRPEPRQYYGPSGIGRVCAGPDGTAAQAESIRVAAWEEARALGLEELLDERA